MTLRNSAAIEVFEEWNENSAGSAKFLTQIADGRGPRLRNECNDRVLHLLKTLAQENNVLANIDNLALFN